MEIICSAPLCYGLWGGCFGIAPLPYYYYYYLAS
jgi:hypothetical protein